MEFVFKGSPLFPWLVWLVQPSIFPAYGLVSQGGMTWENPKRPATWIPFTTNLAATVSVHSASPYEPWLPLRRGHQTHRKRATMQVESLSWFFMESRSLCDRETEAVLTSSSQDSSCLSLRIKVFFKKNHGSHLVLLHGRVEVLLKKVNNKNVFIEHLLWSTHCSKPLQLLLYLILTVTLK